jgi:molybdopterin-biosynthesis enzyme MoeA-like protein
MNHNGDQFGMSQEDVNSEMQSKMQAKYAPEMSQKGTSKRSLEKRADVQRIQESDITSKMTSSQKYERDVKSGVQGAKNAVYLNPTVQEAMSNPDTLGGPVSGAALAKLRGKGKK